MKLTRSFTLPEEDPVVPEHLVERITDWFPYTCKVDIKRKQRSGWKVLTTVQLEGNEEPSDLYTMIKAYADYDVGKRGEPGKYRALVWRLMPGEVWERRRVTFPVHPHDDEDEDDVSSLDPTVDQALQRKAWQEIFSAQQEFIGSMAEFSHRATDRLLEQSKQDSERLTPLSDVIHELVVPYRDGLRMKADAIREVGDLRVRQQLAEAKANDSGKFWDTFGPAIQVAAVQAQQRFLGGGRGGARALPPAAPAAASAPVVQRRVVRAAAAPPKAPPSSPPAAAPSTRPAAPPSPPEAPSSLHQLAAALLHGLPADTLVRLTRMLDDDQSTYLEAIAAASDDDESADAIVSLMQSLMSNPTALVSMQRVLAPDEIDAFQQLAVLATRYIEERGAPPDGDSSSARGDAHATASPEPYDDADADAP